MRREVLKFCVGCLPAIFWVNYTLLQGWRMRIDYANEIFFACAVISYFFWWDVMVEVLREWDIIGDLRKLDKKKLALTMVMWLGFVAWVKFSTTEIGG